LILRYIRQRYQYFFGEDRATIRRIQEITGVYPINLSIYQLAMQHSSAAGKLTENNERLELLGDSVIDLAVADHLFRHFPYKSEGFLTEMRAKLVSRGMLNDIAIRMGLKDLIVRRASEADFHKSSIAGNALEALVGAIYLDQGYPVAQRFVLERMVKPYVDLDDMVRTTVNFKSKLLEWCQKRQKKLQFKLVNERREKNKWIYTMAAMVDGEKVGRGSESSKKRAEQLAAEDAVNFLGIDQDEGG
jgi:ribonuclease III